MIKRACFLVLMVGLVFTTFAQKKITEDKLKAVSGVAIGGQDQSAEQIKQKAINDAKINALKKAGIEENISSYTDYFRSETEHTMEELFTSDILTNINGTVKDIELIEAVPTITPEMQIRIDVKINCTVVKYETKKDPSFSAWIENVKKFYKVGEGMSFTVKPTRDCYIRAFIFTTDSYVLLPNNWEPSTLLQSHTVYTFPNEDVIGSYEITIDNPKLDRETNRLVILLLKQDIYYTGTVNYKDITDWIMSIPPDERLIESFAYDVFKEK